MYIEITRLRNYNSCAIFFNFDCHTFEISICHTKSDGNKNGKIRKNIFYIYFEWWQKCSNCKLINITFYSILTKF